MAEALFLDNKRNLIRITVKDRDSFGSEKMISERVIEVGSQKQLTAQRAKKILAREHPEIGLLIVTKRESGFVVHKAVKPTEKCRYHFIWREYFISQD